MKRVIALLAACIIGIGACARHEPAQAPEVSSSRPLPSHLNGRGPHGGQMGPGRGPHMACPRGEGPLAESTRMAIERALADERAAESKYEATERTLGPVMPFRQFERAERRHAWALEQLYVAHGAAPPAAASADASVQVASLQEACRLGVQVENANIALYDELLNADLPADVRCVFEHLQAASREHHLPRFQRCAAGP